MKAKTLILILAALCFVGVMVSYGADDASMGTWKLNEAKSKFGPGAPKVTKVVTREGRPGMSPNLQMFAQDCSEEELRAVCKELFIPQRDHGIHAHRPPCRHIAGRECNSGEDDNHSSERDGIRRADAVDYLRH
jgi:hypothetical protein